LSVVLWFSIREALTEEFPGYKIPLIVKAPEEMVVVKKRVDTVNITLRGPRNLRLESFKDIKAEYRIKDAGRAGEYSFFLSPSDINNPPGTKVVSIEPSEIKVELDKIIKRKLPVEPEIIGEPAAGYKLDKEKIKLDPNTCLISGPKRIINSITYIKTKPIDVTGRIRPFTKRVELERLVEGQPAAQELIELTIPIEEDYTRKEFKDISLHILGGPLESFRVKTSPEKVNLILGGKRPVLDKLNPAELITYVKISGLKKGKYQLPMQLILPGETVLLSEVPVIDVEVEDLLTPRLEKEE